MLLGTFIVMQTLNQSLMVGTDPHRTKTICNSPPRRLCWHRKRAGPPTWNARQRILHLELDHQWNMEYRRAVLEIRSVVATEREGVFKDAEGAGREEHQVAAGYRG